MLTQKSINRADINLKGSVQTICDYFSYSISSILYVRTVYPEEYFEREKHYDVTIHMIKNPTVISYINKSITGIQKLLYQNKARKLIVALMDKNTEETLERWSFTIETDPVSVESQPQSDAVKRDIQVIMRQIMATTSFLPSLECGVSFRILLVTEGDSEHESSWIECDPHFIPNSENVELKSFHTGTHKVSTSVSYKVDDNYLL